MALISNKKAHFNYTIGDTIEAGIELVGPEVKSVKGGQGSLEGTKVIIRGGEAYIIGLFIPPYQQKNTLASYDATRTRRLLLNKSEILRLQGNMSQQPQLTLIPLSLYSSHNRIKVQVALCTSKHKADKREDIRKKEDALRMRRIKSGFME